MTEFPRVFADFNDLLSSPRRLWLDTVGAREDLQRQGIELREGLEITLYDHDLDEAGNRDDLIVEGVVSRDPATGTWMATIDPDTIRHESNDRPAN
jgi:hypothetical protein